MNDKLRIHTHPIMERKLNVPDGHVIIDAALYMELLRRHGDRLPPKTSWNNFVEEYIEKATNEIRKATRGT
jgi:hypothetical protein